MPTYEYKCDACGHGFERFESITAEPIRKCPECGKLKVKRLIGTGAGMIFKGSGFYITDYRSEGYKSAAKAETGGSGSTSGESKPAGDAKPAAASTDAKPAARSEPKPAPPAKPASGGDKKQ